MNNITELLLSLKDYEYARFQQKLIPNIDSDRIIGVRVPKLRNIAKSFDQSQADSFLSLTSHYYLEENYLHAFLIERYKDFDRCIELCDKFLPFVDNWAVCDSLNPKIFAKNRDLLIVHIEKWLKSSHEYTVRFAIKMLMTYYLGKNFSIKYPQMVVAAQREYYYVSMMIAWYFATALAKNYDDVIGFIENSVLDKVTHNRAVQKAVESYRISSDKKIYLKTLRLKNIG